MLVISGTSDPPDYTYCGDDALCDAPSLPSDFSVVKTDSQGNTESWSKVTVSGKFITTLDAHLKFAILFSKAQSLYRKLLHHASFYQIGKWSYQQCLRTP